MISPPDLNHPVDYDLVLRDLRRRHAQLENAIKAIEGLLAGTDWGSYPDNEHTQLTPSNQRTNASYPALSTQPPPRNPSAQSALGSRGSSPVLVLGHRFSRSSILQASRILMKERGQAMSAQAIANALTEQGYIAKSRNLTNTVASVLNRHDKVGGDIIRVGRNLFSLVSAKERSETQNEST